MKDTAMRTSLSTLTLCVALIAVPLHAQAQQAFGEAFSGFRSGSDKPIEIEADSLEVQDKEKTAIFKGNVDVRQGTSHLKSSILKVFYKGAATETGSNQDIDKLEASGKVWVQSGKNTATGNAAYFNMATKVVVLEGNVVLSQCDNIIKGSSLTVNLNTGLSQLKSDSASGRVQGLLVPGGNNSAASNC